MHQMPQSGLRRKIFYRDSLGFRGTRGGSPFCVAVYVLKRLPRVPLPDVPEPLDENGHCGWEQIARLQSHIRQHQYRMRKAMWAQTEYHPQRGAA